MSSNGSPVARWLNTFVNNSNISKEYVDIFKKFGYETLNEVEKSFKSRHVLFEFELKLKN